MKSFSSRLKEAMDAKGYKQTDLARASGIDKSLISNYLSGNYKARQDNLYILAKALDVSEAWLMGYDAPAERQHMRQPHDIDDLSQYGIMPITTQRIPLLGDIACGEPIYANEDRASYVEVGTEIKADFCLRAKGDSMVNARILDGDIVFIRQQEIVADGEIAAVLIEDEATLKRVYYDRENGILQLVAENPAFKPLVYTGEQLNHIRILGKAIAFQSDVI